MPITKSAKKAVKVNEKRRSRNRHFLDIYKESLKSLEKLMKSPDKNAKNLQESLSLVYSRIDTLEKKNILHINTAARRKSFLAKKVKSLSI